MSEYWKSTPKYWCKFCKLYVRDTTLEKKQHEATPKHQNNIQRSLRDLHKTSEREDREKQRAKDEVARLNGLVSGKSQPSLTSASSSQPSVPKPRSVASASSTGPASVAERKRQMEQLASMGIAIPEEYRRDLSLAGEWSTVSERPVYSKPVKSAQDDEDDDDESKAFGVRKRKLDDEEEQVVPKAWGSRLKSYPGAKANSEQDLDALLSEAAAKKNIKTEEGDMPKEEPDADSLKPMAAVPNSEGEDAVAPKIEAAQDAPVVFKKRKAKR